MHARICACRCINYACYFGPIDLSLSVLLLLHAGLGCVLLLAGGGTMAHLPCMAFDIHEVSGRGRLLAHCMQNYARAWSK